MFRDLDSMGSDQSLVYEICIVGTGPSGISLATKFNNTKYSIVMLESGGLLPDPKYQTLNKGKNSGPRFLSLDGSRIRCWGGGSLLWAGHCGQFSQDEFNQKEYIPLSGWPINKEDLNKYYEEASGLLGINYELFGGERYLDDIWNLGLSKFDVQKSFLSESLLLKANSENRNFGTKFKNEIQSSDNIDVIYHATVTNIQLSENRKTVTNLIINSLNGNKAIIKANVYILAAGALENPRLLLASNVGINNAEGNNRHFVGKCFMSHPGVSEAAEIHNTNNVSSVCLKNNNFHNVDKNIIPYLQVKDNLRITNKLLKHSIEIKAYPDLINGSTYWSGRIFSEFDKLKGNFQIMESIEKLLCRLSGNKYNSLLWDVGVGIEQQPRLNNKLNLDGDVDSLGVPLLNMYWDNLSELEKNTIIEAIKLLAQELGMNNTGRIKLTKNLLSGEAFNQQDPINHHIGTTRMSDSILTGVVDKNCKVFSVSNLYLSGSSVFTTSSNVNPTFTIIALSLRLGDHLKKVLISNT
jgi:choline dehydrogenase-like flavoprotein